MSDTTHSLTPEQLAMDPSTGPVVEVLKKIVSTDETERAAKGTEEGK